MHQLRRSGALSGTAARRRRPADAGLICRSMESVAAPRRHGDFGAGRVPPGVRAVGAETVHVHVDQPPQLLDEEIDVYAGAAVDVRRVLVGQDGHTHDVTLWVALRSPPGPTTIGPR